MKERHILQTDALALDTEIAHNDAVVHNDHDDGGGDDGILTLNLTPFCQIKCLPYIILWNYRDIATRTKYNIASAETVLMN